MCWKVKYENSVSFPSIVNTSSWSLDNTANCEGEIPKILLHVVTQKIKYDILISIITYFLWVN